MPSARRRTFVVGRWREKVDGVQKDYHCCATCEHFRITRTDAGIVTRCARLGYATQTRYRFKCWQPRPDIVAKMRQESLSRQSAALNRPVNRDT